MVMEEGKATAFGVKLNPNRLLPLRLLQFFLLFLAIGLGISVVSMYMIKYMKVPNVSALARSNFVFPREDAPKNIKDWIRPPSNLLHEMNDSELFWRASFVPQVKQYPYKRVPKVAFMFLTKGQLPLAPLWERFFKGGEGRYSIYVHALPNYVGNFSSESVFYKRQIPSQTVEWGRMSMCDAERRLLANALLDISNEWFILLSEACDGIVASMEKSIMYRYISRSRYSFMGSFDEPGPNGRDRYHPNMEPEVKLKQWRKGSQWFEVNRKLAVDIVEDSTYYPKFRDFCTPACYVDEHYFPTMLSIQSPHLLANRTLTWTDWSRGGAHPASFGKGDIKEEFLKKMFEQQSCIYNNQPSNLCYLFARKFSPSALDPLLDLASKVFAY